MKTHYALVSDFDGTITEDDFFTLISRRYFNKEMLAPWREYLAGRETHFNALGAMFRQIRLPEAQLKKFIKKIHYDEGFVEAAALCKKKGIPVYIGSAGCDYYINVLIGREIEKYGIKLITNRSIYSKDTGLKMIAPRKNSPYYDEKIGISKRSIVKRLHDSGYKVIFAGDGPPDIEPAKFADVVFARKILLRECRELGVKTKRFTSFENVLKFIRKL